MTRCPNCHRPNPEANEFCGHCGQALLLEKRPWFLVSDWLDKPSAWAALASAFGMALLRILTQARFVIAAANREEGMLAFLFVVLSLGLGLGLGMARGDLRRLWAWAALGAAGGLLSYSLDFFYNYQHEVYRGVWWLVYLFLPSNDNRAGEMAYGILQLLRYAGSSLLLVIAACWELKRGALYLKCALFWLASAGLIYYLRGALLQLPLSWDFVTQFSLYFSAVFLFFYGLARLDENRPK